MILKELINEFLLTERVYKCSQGINKGRIVTSPSLCANHKKKTKKAIIRKYFTNLRTIDKHGWFYHTS